ncbi:MAG: 50S ribosomal protein L4 [Flavobacteriales bacterium]
MKREVYDKNGKKTDRKVELNDSVFGIDPNDHAIYLDVKRYHTHQRQGTHKAKERAELAGSTKKIKRQKGTGTARSGDGKSPIFRGGGTVFGPRPRHHRVELNKKVKALARASALSYKAQEDGGVTVLEDLRFDAPKTKDFAKLLKGLKLDDRKTLVVVPEKDEKLLLSARNFPGSKVITVDQLNTYDIMNASSVVFTESSLEKRTELKK